MKPTIWHGCYNKSLNGFIAPAAFSHPAKFSLGLIERIYDHLLERGWLKRGDCVGDPFGGVAIGGLVAAYRKLEWCGVELEPKFCGLGTLNIMLHESKLKALGATLPRLIMGDSRKFHVLIGESDAVVSSPPYAEMLDGTRKANGIDFSKAQEGGKTKTDARASYGCEFGGTAGQIGRLKSGEVNGVISSPPYSDTAVEKKQWQTYRSQGGGMSLEAFTAQQARHSEGYGQSSGQIAALKGGSVDACISSPPYAENPKAPPLPKHRVRGSSSPNEHGGPGPAYVSPNSQGQIGVLKEGSVEGVVSSPPYAGNGQRSGTESHPERCEGSGKSISLRAGYGESDGQIDNLKTGDVEAVVSSPPFETSSHVNNTMFGLKPGKGIHSEVAGVRAKKDYIDPDSPGQIGQEKAESYWQAMDLVYRSCFQAIKPGGVIAIVVKDYCKAGKRVRLCDDTLKLLCHIGFTPLERIHAMLVSETVEAGLFGEERTKRQPKSFFRRLHEYLIQAQIHWVNVERKPLLLRRAKAELWSEYRDRVDNATEKEKSDPILWPPPKPTASKVLREAQFFAWREAGKPMRADERRIDHEEVLVCRKPQ